MCAINLYLIIVRYYILFCMYIVATVRFEEPEYTFQEDSGTGEVCLIKDLATPDSVTVQVPTTDITATGKPHPPTINF